MLCVLYRSDIGQYGAGIVQRLSSLPVHEIADEDQVQTGPHPLPYGHPTLRHMPRELLVFHASHESQLVSI